MHTDELRIVLVDAVILLYACVFNRITLMGSIDTAQIPRTGILPLPATYTARYCGSADP